MNALSRRGFTLVELLVVIAIIATLASFLAVAAPRVLESAKLRKLESNALNLRTSLTQYYTQHQSYPPGYGFVAKNFKDDNDPTDNAPDAFYHLRPYTSLLRLDNADDLNDNFSDGTETLRPFDDQLNILEYLPVGTTAATTLRTQFPQDRYEGPGTASGTVANDIGKQLQRDSRPMVYIPVNARQANRARQYWVENGAWFADRWEPSDANFPRMVFPPPNYDAYVLVSVGPGGSTYGILPEPLGTEPDRDLYHITALRAYFLATRDLNNNGALDFDFEARRGDEAAVQYQVNVNGTPLDPTPSGGLCASTQCYPNSLPDLFTAPNGYGPYIFRSPS
jgi:prepilin-type N-terminal cleavage/methylation domain-containing protein